MKVAIVIDNWKSPIFEKTLKEEKYKYKKINNCPIKDSITLKIETDDVDRLGVVVKKMNDKASKSKMN